MTIQTINIGNIVNDGLGDDLRTAFQKVNDNFTTLSNELTISVSNIGNAGDGVGIFKQRSGGTLEFKRLKEGKNINLDEYDNYIEVKNTADEAFTKIFTNSGTEDATIHKEITLAGYAQGNNSPLIDVTTLGNGVIRFGTVIPVTEILTVYDFGSLSGSFNNSMQFALAWANVDFGEITLPGTINLDCGGI
jgi:hypothetical protein